MHVSFSNKLFSLILLFLTFSCSERTVNNNQSPIIACPTIVSGNSSSMSSDLSIITTVENTADNISQTQLTVPGDSVSVSNSDVTIRFIANYPLKLLTLELSP